MIVREDKESRRVHVIDNVVAEDRLSRLRDVKTDAPEFRSLMRELGRICGYEIVNERLDTQQKEVETPLGVYPSEIVEGEKRLIIVNVLRAATPLVEGLSESIPKARLGVVSASRVEDDSESPDVENEGFSVEVGYMKLPDVREDSIVVLADPMLATGSTVDAVLEGLRSTYSENIEVISLSVVSSPEGIQRVSEQHPDVSFFTVSIDYGLNDDGYIIPGLGDAGDRAFGTEK